ncbi:hypothetical protein ACDF64_11005 [Agromyces sp. MMS24-JH15]
MTGIILIALVIALAVWGVAATVRSVRSDGYRPSSSSDEFRLGGGRPA